MLFYNRLKGVYVPPDEVAQCSRALLQRLEGGGVVKLDFSTARPLVRCAAMGKCLRFLVQQFAVSPNASALALTCRTVQLLVRAYCRRGVLQGDMAFLSPFCHRDIR